MNFLTALFKTIDPMTPSMKIEKLCASSSLHHRRTHSSTISQHKTIKRMYKSLADPPAGDLKDAPDFIATRVVSKFCSFGMVASKSWSDTYLTIIDGIVRLYDSEETCRVDPRKFVMEIPLGRSHRASAIQKKNYSKDKMQVIDFYCFYLEVDNGIFSATKMIKLGSLSEATAQSIVNCIAYRSQKASF